MNEYIIHLCKKYLKYIINRDTLSFKVTLALRGRCCWFTECIHTPLRKGLRLNTTNLRVFENPSMTVKIFGHPFVVRWVAPMLWKYRRKHPNDLGFRKKMSMIITYVAMVPRLFWSKRDLLETEKFSIFTDFIYWQSNFNWSAVQVHLCWIPW